MTCITSSVERPRIGGLPEPPQASRRLGPRQRRRKARCHSAFTLIELMIVVVIIGVILNIALPSFIRARESARGKACIANLKEIDSSKEQYAMDNKLATGAADPGMPALVGASNYIKSTPICQTGGSYTVAAIGTSPTCSIGANSVSTFAPHQLP